MRKWRLQTDCGTHARLASKAYSNVFRLFLFWTLRSMCPCHVSLILHMVNRAARQLDTDSLGVTWESESASVRSESQRKQTTKPRNFFLLQRRLVRGERRSECARGGHCGALSRRHTNRYGMFAVAANTASVAAARAAAAPTSAGVRAAAAAPRVVSLHSHMGALAAAAASR